MTALDSLYEALTIKAQTINREITKEIVEDWVENAGPADRQIAFLTATLDDLQSGKYTAGELVEDILQLSYLDN